MVKRVLVLTVGNGRSATVLTSKVTSNVKLFKRTKGRRGCGLLFRLTLRGRIYSTVMLSR